MTTISPPSLLLLTIGSFSTIYDAFVNYPRFEKEFPYAIGNIFLNVIEIGAGCVISEYFYKSNLKLFSWIFCIIPIIFVITVSIIIIISRLKVEQEIITPKPKKIIRLDKKHKNKILTNLQKLQKKIII